MSHTKPNPRAVTYLRISSDADDDEHGVDAQRAACYELAAKQGLDMVGEYKDNDRSAYSRKPRPDFEKLLADMADGSLFDVVIIFAADRLYRRVADLVRITDVLENSPARIAQVTGGDVDLSTADGIMHAQILGSIAERESRIKSERLALRAGHRAREEGRMISSKLPGGWRWVEPCPAGDDCHHKHTCERPGLRPRQGSRAGMEPDPVEAPLVAKAYQMVADGGSLNACARMFNEAGVPARYSDRWKASTMRTVLLNPRNAALVGHKGEVVAEASNGHKIVSVDLYQKVRTILTDEKRKTAGRPAGTVFSAIAECGKCSGPANASRKMNAPVYICGRHQHQSRRRHLVDGPGLALVRDWFVDNASALADYAEPEPDPTQAKAAKEVETLKDRLGALSELAATGELDPDDYARTARTVRERLAAAQQRAVVVSGRPAVARLLSEDDPGAGFDRLVEAAESGDVEPLRAVLKELLDGLVMVPGKRGGDGLQPRWQQWATAAVDGAEDAA